MNKQKFLEEYRKTAREKSSDIDIALVNLLIAFDEQIDGLYDEPAYFHKAFRQTDVVNIRGIDGAIWSLLNASNMFWEIFSRYTLVDDNQ